MGQIRRPNRRPGTWVLTPGSRAVLEEIVRSPGVTVQELAARLGRAPVDMAPVVETAIDLGLLRTSVGDGPYVLGEWVTGAGYRWTATASGVALLAPKKLAKKRKS